MSEQLGRAIPTSGDAIVSGSDGDELRLTRRELAGRLGRAIAAGGAAYLGRPVVRELLREVGFRGTGHGLIAAAARRAFRFWWWGKRWPR
jgi:hypothetical protein